MNLLSLTCTCFLFALAAGTSDSQTTALVFNVDMKPTGLYKKGNPLNVRIKGDVEPLNWTEGIKMSDPDDDGIYSATINFLGNGKKELIYKYVVNNVEWETGDNLKIEIKPTAKPFNSVFRYQQRPGNPFKRFIGEWTLKDDNFEHGDGKSIQQVKIRDHYTICKEVNTDNSLLWIVDATSAKGHIFWSYNSSKKEVNWASSFYSYRSGVGNGKVTDNGDATFKISFEGEPEGTYRLYTYKWISENEYEMKSFQYNTNNEPTGSYYGGTFIRINKK
jgi:hypothetical protein